MGKKKQKTNQKEITKTKKYAESSELKTAKQFKLKQ